MKKIKYNTNVILVGLMLMGVLLLLYPTVADLWNRRVSTRAIDNYEETIQALTEEQTLEQMALAQEYNEKLQELSMPLIQYDQIEGYEEAINPAGNGLMGYVTIPKIDVELPVYHGTSEQVLKRAAGHLEGTSLPTGGEGNHTVLSAHRGLPSAKLFTYLDKLKTGDTFSLKIMNRRLTYVVDQIRIIEPDEVNDLKLEEGKDYCTLLTCTPYGINTQRLLVRGVRASKDMPVFYVENQAFEIDSIVVAPALAVPMLVVWLAILLRKKPAKKKDAAAAKEEMNPDQNQE